MFKQGIRSAVTAGMISRRQAIQEDQAAALAESPQYVRVMYGQLLAKIEMSMVKGEFFPSGYQEEDVRTLVYEIAPAARVLHLFDIDPISSFPEMVPFNVTVNNQYGLDIEVPDVTLARALGYTGNPGDLTEHITTVVNNLVGNPAILVTTEHVAEKGYLTVNIQDC